MNENPQAVPPGAVRQDARAHVDHLVLLAATLDEGAAWCQALLGVALQPGGKHALMGTHNRLLNVSSVEFPGAYLEVIAIDSEAESARPSCAKRWFDMDSEALLLDVAVHGPRLIHFVARVPRIGAAVAALAGLGIDRGAVLDASRATPLGELRWRISVRRDGQRLFDGALPTLIEWGRGTAAHPASAMAPSGVALRWLRIAHPRAANLAAAYGAIGLDSVMLGAAPEPRLSAMLGTPRGAVELCG